MLLTVSNAGSLLVIVHAVCMNGRDGRVCLSGFCLRYVCVEASARRCVRVWCCVCATLCVCCCFQIANHYKNEFDVLRSLPPHQNINAYIGHFEAELPDVVFDGLSGVCVCVLCAI